MMHVPAENMPETPERQFGKELHNNVETPRTGKSLKYKLKSPQISGILDKISNSPERRGSTLKRHALEELGNTAKLLKRYENCSVSRVRAALFQEKPREIKSRNITLSTKSFYSNSGEKKNYRISYKLTEQKYQRKSLTGHTVYVRKSPKRHTIGGINAGVSHGIKKPKSKDHSVATRNSASDTAENDTNGFGTNEITNSAITEEVIDSEEEQNNISIERSASPEIDLSKRFFKTKKTPMRSGLSTVTISKNVKLKVAKSGELTLNKENIRLKRQTQKRPKPKMDISFDAADLTVNEPELEGAIEENNVANILKMLEDDWANDDYDILEALTSGKLQNISALEPVKVSQNDPMLASELSHASSTMTITDLDTPLTSKNISLDDNENNVKENKEKYYPIFNKGHSANNAFDDTNGKSTNSKKDNVNWQLSAKGNGDKNQYQLDAGQKNFGATQCTECGIVYQVGDPEDENAHLNYHNNRKTLKFPGWKTERVIIEDPLTSSRIILIEPDDPKQCWNKVIEVLKYVDRDLGLVDTNLEEYESKKVYLYIRDKSVLGVLVVEHINSAYRMIPELLELNCCTAESTSAKCGINVVWTELNHRRQGIATKLVDILRSQFYYGYIMSLDDIAFSTPTPSGIIFAEKYTKTRNFKVYS